MADKLVVNKLVVNKLVVNKFVVNKFVVNKFVPETAPDTCLVYKRKEVPSSKTTMTRNSIIVIVFLLVCASVVAYQSGKLNFSRSKSTDSAAISPPIHGTWIETDETNLYEFKADGAFYIGSVALNSKTLVGTYSRVDATHIRITSKSGTSQTMRFEISENGTDAIVQHPSAGERLFKRQAS